MQSAILRNMRNPIRHNIFRPQYLLIVGLVLIIGGVFHYMFGLGLLWPGNIDPILKADTATHYLGWAFYRNTPWTFPIGEVQGYFHPLGTNIGFTDSIPLFAVFFKIFSPILPQNFQYIGLWLACCYLFQTIFAYKILKQSGWTDWVNIGIGTLLLSLSPVLIFRQAHPALCAHAMILASIWVYMLDPTKTGVRRILIYQGIILLASAWIHPYLGFMIMGFAFVLMLKLWLGDKVIKSYLALLAFVIGIASVGLSWYLIGYFSISSKGAMSLGFGDYTMNLNAWVNNYDLGTFLPAFPYRPLQEYEGYAYLGLGLLLLAVVGIVLRLIRKNRVQESEVHSGNYRPLWLPLILFAVLSTLFAIGPKPSMGEHILFDSWGDGKFTQFVFLEELANTFRSSGRFAWPGYYLLVCGMLFSLSNVSFKKWILMGAVLVQCIDLFPLAKDIHFKYRSIKPWPVEQEKWEEVFAIPDKIVFTPPFKRLYIRDVNDFAPFSVIAQHMRKPITLGYVARTETQKMFNYMAQVGEDVKAGKIEPGVLYVTVIDFLPNYASIIKEEKALWLQLDGFTVFLPKTSPPEMLKQFSAIEASRDIPRFESIEEYFRKYTDEMVIIVARDEATFRLNDDAKAAFRARGSGIDSLRFRGSITTIIQGDTVVFEHINNQGKAEFLGGPGERIGKWTLPDSLHVISGGKVSNLPTSVRLGSRELSLDKRGLNFVTFDSLFQSVDQANFDTYSKSVREIQ